MRLRHDNGLGIKITAKSIAFMMGLSFNQVRAIYWSISLMGTNLLKTDEDIINVKMFLHLNSSLLLHLSRHFRDRHLCQVMIEFKIYY